MKKSTTELLELLKKSSDISAFVESVSEDFIEKTPLYIYLNQLLTRKQLKKSNVIRQSGLDRSYAYEIFSGNKIPSRDKVLALCFSMSLSEKEVINLLNATGYPHLYAKFERDSVLLFCLQHHLSLTDANELLFEMDFPLLV